MVVTRCCCRSCSLMLQDCDCRCYWRQGCSKISLQIEATQQPSHPHKNWRFEYDTDQLACKIGLVIHELGSAVVPSIVNWSVLYISWFRWSHCASLATVRPVCVYVFVSIIMCPCLFVCKIVRFCLWVSCLCYFWMCVFQWLDSVFARAKEGIALVYAIVYGHHKPVDRARLRLQHHATSWCWTSHSDFSCNLNHAR